MTPILHVQIPGEPIAQERHRWTPRSRFGHNYDPNAKEKENFQWQVKCAAPKLEPVDEKPLGIIIEVWTAKPPVDEWERIPGTKKRRKTGRRRFQTDWDNYGKFYCDALSGLVWKNDCWIEDGRVIVHRNAATPSVKILVWELLR